MRSTVKKGRQNCFHFKEFSVKSHLSLWTENHMVTIVKNPYFSNDFKWTRYTVYTYPFDESHTSVPYDFTKYLKN